MHRAICALIFRSCFASFWLFCNVEYENEVKIALDFGLIYLASMIWIFSFFSILHQVNGCLSYFDKVPDGFYSIHGMDPYVWTVCSDLQESGHIPSLESLKIMDPSALSSIEVISVDRRSDSSLKELQNWTHNVSSSCMNTKEIVVQLANLVCNRMGWALAYPILKIKFIYLILVVIDLSCFLKVCSIQWRRWLVYQLERA